MVRVETTFRTFWRGHEIVVRNWWNIFGFTGEELWIDGQPKVRQQIWIFRLETTLSTTLSVDGAPVTLSAWLGPDSLNIGCRLYADGVEIARHGNAAVAAQEREGDIH